MLVARTRIIATAAILTLAAGCGDSRDLTAPVASSGAPARSLLSGPSTVKVVTRNTPLASPQTASAVIGLFGGQLALPGAGLSVLIPPLALSSPTRITVTAVAGSQVAYEFEPHGTRFRVPLLVTQNLNGTSAVSGGLLPKPIIAGYFANLSDINLLNSTALVSELLGTSVSLLTRTATFPVFHFSGYLIATGDDDDDSRVSAR